MISQKTHAYQTRTVEGSKRATTQRGGGSLSHKNTRTHSRTRIKGTGELQESLSWLIQ